MSKKEIIRKAKARLTPALVFHTGIAAKKAKGIYVDDAGGRRYMDFSSGLATTNIGHCPASVIKAARKQMDALIHSGCIFYYESEAVLAEKLSRITPDGIDMFFFSNSGAEAIEGAIKLARYYTGRQGIIAFTGGFHGRTAGALSLTTSSARYRRHYHPLLPSVFHAPYPYCYRCPMGKTRDVCGVDCFTYLRDTILKRQITPDEAACVVIEPVLGEGGYVVPPADYMKKLRALCREEGIMFIADEVQTGFGRTGRWFACEHFDIRPDIITMAKGIASGFPLSAVGASTAVMERWQPGTHGTTFGGNPVSCAASLATINTIEKERILDNARSVGAYALERLRGMQKKHYPIIGDVRGLGLMIGVEVVDPNGAPDKKRLKKIIRRCFDKGLIIVECGMEKNIARLMPPLIVSKREMDIAIDIFEEGLR
ncbi:MAG: aspartate aminotransferase family protein [Deltaproteobacteria bacterium]|nr:aspartate aminotransferase family protein [Deltaproteobacteria bacterium]